MTTSNNEQLQNQFFIAYIVFGIGSFFYLIWMGLREGKITVGWVLGSLLFSALPINFVLWFPLIAEICSITIWKRK